MGIYNNRTSIFFIFFCIIILVWIIYLTGFRFIRKITPVTTISLRDLSTPFNDDNKLDCDLNAVYCNIDSDCAQLCNQNAAAVTNSTVVGKAYKCNQFHRCIQSVNDNEPNINTNNNIPNCNRDFGFFPVLISDEVLGQRWTCLNTEPYIFDDKQTYHSYICAGGNRKNLNPKKLYDSCKCPKEKLKVRDEFRNDIPICIDQNQLPLFPNLLI